jgi:putative membrane protein insertion efficiency factor
VTGPSTLARLLVSLLDLYKRFLSPLLPPACRFSPTCSVYAREAIARHGAVRGIGLALSRLVRCHPFHRGGFDLVP